MKLIIAGSRSVVDYNVVKKAYLESGLKATEIVSGGARGVDKLGEAVAKELGIPIKVFPARWDEFGKSAGYKRNVEMGNYANAALVIWDGSSKGSKHMIDTMKMLAKIVVVHYTNK